LDVAKRFEEAKISICTTCPPEFFTLFIIEDLLIPFCIFDIESYDLGLSPHIYAYQSVVWTNQKISILSVIYVFVAPTFGEIIIHPKGEVVN
jgi:hypothetical protein